MYVEVEAYRRWPRLEAKVAKVEVEAASDRFGARCRDNPQRRGDHPRIIESPSTLSAASSGHPLPAPAKIQKLALLIHLFPLSYSYCENSVLKYPSLHTKNVNINLPQQFCPMSWLRVSPLTVCIQASARLILSLGRCHCQGLMARFRMRKV